MPRDDSPLMRWDDLFARPRPVADESLSYGPDPLQRISLWRPAGPPPHAAVLMVHGGCWQTDVADAGIMDFIAGDLRARGIAVWNIDYRGVDRPGGGYPGSFQDVAAAADLLGREGADHGLATERIVAVGHSAGGHLALWLAARNGLSPDSPLHRPAALPIAATISLGGLPDLEMAADPQWATCEVAPVEALVGKSRRTGDPYADTSPARLPPGPGAMILVNGARDAIAPPHFATRFAETMAAKGALVHKVVVPGEGHVELITPGTRAWSRTVRLIETALG